jgi:solute carrier family 8 (sodium/calcium exchanger)
MYVYMYVNDRPLEPESTQLKRDPPHEEEKFLVFKCELLQLFQFCKRCHFPALGTIQKRLGTCIHVEQKCPKCSYVFNWSSQPYIGKMPGGNLLLSGSILVSGCLSSKCLLMFKLLNMACIGRSTFFRYFKMISDCQIVTF